MKKEEFKIGIEEIKKIGMTKEEKNRIFENILDSEIPQKKTIPSPWFNSLTFVIQRNKIASYGLAVFLIISITGGSLAQASEKSLPGSTLYPIKTKIVEPVQSTLKLDPQNRAKYEGGLVIKRLTEAEVLVLQNKLNEKKESQLNDLLDTHTLNLNKSLKEIPQTKSLEKDSMILDFHAEINAHARVLEVVGTRTDLSKQIESISNTARINADKIENSLKDKEEDKSINSDEISEKYKKKKDTIKSLIDSTADDLDKEDEDSSTIKQIIIKDTYEKLDQAKKFLEKAEEQDEDGDLEDAYYSLLDSESNAKEANFFLKTEDKFKEIENKEAKKSQEHRKNSED